MKAKMTSNALRSKAMVPAFSNFPDIVKNIWPKKLRAPTMTIRKRSWPEAGRHVWPNRRATAKASEKPMKPNQDTVTDQWISRENINRKRPIIKNTLRKILVKRKWDPRHYFPTLLGLFWSENLMWKMMIRVGGISINFPQILLLLFQHHMLPYVRNALDLH